MLNKEWGDSLKCDDRGGVVGVECVGIKCDDRVV